MVFTGLLVLPVRLQEAFAGESGQALWLMFGPGVLASLMLFARTGPGQAMNQAVTAFAGVSGFPY